MTTGLAPVIIIMLVGTPTSMISGYIGGRTDNMIMRITDIFFAFPDLLIDIIMIATLRDIPLGQ
jgi:ABC-type dipeptide/oligopeptide/nickel transport system permease subunit